MNIAGSLVVVEIDGRGFLGSTGLAGPLGAGADGWAD